ncbi:MAG: thioredoxin [Planctomycetota bacterium]|nr:thioredoxin [Planctomycetota bacterium]
MANLPAFTDENFEAEVKQSDTPVLVDFGAEWCGPCRALAPIVEGLAGEYGDRLKVGTVDIDKAQGIARDFQIMSVPTIIFFKGGEVVDKVTGLQSKAKLQQYIDKVLA